MPKIKEIKKHGSLFLEQIQIKNVYYTKVKPHNATAGRIYLPVSLVGKSVYVILEAMHKLDDDAVIEKTTEGEIHNE